MARDALELVPVQLKAINNPKLTQPVFDAFLAKLPPPAAVCFGDWGECDCVQIIPP